MDFAIDCCPRPKLNPNTLRRSGQIPTVLYGHNGTESLSLIADKKSVLALLLGAKVNNSLVTVNIKELGLSFKTLLKEVQSHPYNRDIYQLSFFAVNAQKQLTINVPLNFTGQASGVTEEDGSMDIVLNSLEVHCLSGVIPEQINVDVSQLKVGQMLHVQDLVLPEGVTSTGASDRVVVSVVAQ
ncbi:MAG: 50S ribosomal protein L25 [Aphanocapsa sp. GSE-SYN-MK-11-07L]|jgi:large subunit ribosomal protein L25|nr:50S ribosomal protein L25 [Aphanocapsa sp. GSE-SYN-MK-11-07L]